MALSDYQSQVLALLNDPTATFFSTAQITTWINTARARIAAMSGCIRWLPPNSSNETVALQEAYPLSGLTPVIPAGSGMLQVLRVHSVAVWSAAAAGSQKPVWERVAWDKFQAEIRILNGQYQGQMSQPGAWTQYGRGTSASVYLGPIPTAVVPMDWDCVMVPIHLAVDTDPEAIPYPWTDIVQYGAQREAYIAQQRIPDAEQIDKLIAMMIQQAPTLAEGHVLLADSYSRPGEL